MELFDRIDDDPRKQIADAGKRMDLWPCYHAVGSSTGPVVEMEGKQRLMFGSSNYLGLAHDERVCDAAREAIGRYGTATSGSRILNGTLELHEEIEHELADWLGTEDAVTFTSGYQTNVGTLSALLRRGDAAICDSGSHASILDGVELSGATLRPFRHARLDRLEAALAVRGDDEEGARIVTVDGIFSMAGDVLDLEEVSRLCRNAGVPLYVDEAHALGVLGARGAGACEVYGIEDEVALRVGTLSKTVASLGGFAAGPREVMEYLRVKARSLLFTAGTPPASAAAALAAIRICRTPERELRVAALMQNARYLRDGLIELGFDVAPLATGPDGAEVMTPIIPVRIGPESRAVSLWRMLYDAGLYVHSVAYPAVARQNALLRLTVTSAHESAHIDQLLAECERARDKSVGGHFAGRR